MQFDWTEEQKEIRTRYYSLGTELANQESNVRDEFNLKGWQRLLQEGLWQYIVPSDHGGNGLGWWHFTAALEGLASSIRKPGLLLSIIAQAGMVRALTLYGNDNQRERYFAAILQGKLSATAIAEPETGTDTRNIKTLLTEDEHGYLLTGEKYNIAHAPLAQFTLVVTRLTNTENQGGIALVIIDRATMGISYQEPDHKLGLADLPTGGMRFENVRIAHEQLLGKPGAGHKNLIQIISLGRVYYGLVAALIPTCFMKDALSYIHSRSSFGSTIDRYQYVQKRIVEIQIGIERSRWLAYGALSHLLNDHTEQEILMVSSIAKIIGAHDLVDSATSLLKLYGSVGYQQGQVADFVRDALGFCSVGGTEEMHKKTIFNQINRLTAYKAR
ncbi:acyl-CoA dehydrogenase family protein [Serratia fonticola]|uniref:acyl-CoA dehydrogenase family protein n=1 Tax=Serratia fonticola TaxID=47917 RepID=UPI0021AE05AB|nr:acyl-CoA dehydrogenase family protein [Serratia fonticola]